MVFKETETILKIVEGEVTATVWCVVVFWVKENDANNLNMTEGYL